MAHKFDDDDVRHTRKNKPAKHSRNIPGQGMRVLNDWQEDDYDDFDDEVSVYDSISFVLSKKQYK